MASNYNEHQIPSFVFKYKLFIQIIHWWNRIILQRNWHITRKLRSSLSTPVQQKVLDVGCGDGQFLFHGEKHFPKHKFSGIDRIENNVKFCNHYLQKNNCRMGDLEEHPLHENYDLQLLFGVLQYIKKDESALQHLEQHLTSTGKILMYVPINGKTFLPFYDHVLNKFNHYEVIQNRQRVYSEPELEKVLKAANLEIHSKEYCIGTLGTLSHEIYTLFLALLSKSPHPFISVLMTLFILYPLIPSLLILNLLDHLIPKNNGNGLLLEVGRSK